MFHFQVGHWSAEQTALMRRFRQRAHDGGEEMSATALGQLTVRYKDPRAMLASVRPRSRGLPMERMPFP
jgi:hypothetical protein